MSNSNLKSKPPLKSYSNFSRTKQIEKESRANKAAAVFHIILKPFKNIAFTKPGGVFKTRTYTKT